MNKYIYWAFSNNYIGIYIDAHFILIIENGNGGAVSTCRNIKLHQKFKFNEKYKFKKEITK